MATAMLMAPARQTGHAAPSPLAALLLARLHCGPQATRTELARDLGPWLAPKLAPSEQHDAIDGALRLLSGQAQACEQQGRLSLTQAGEAAARTALGGKVLPKSWVETRDVRLVALALGLEREPASRMKALAKPDGLRAAIVQGAFDLTNRDAASPSRLRSALAVVALERAFGNKIKGGLGSGKGLSAKTARLLAAQLAARPRDFGTDSRLIAALAADRAGTTDPSAESLRLALVRRYVAADLRPPPRIPAPAVATDTEPPASPQPIAPPRPAAATRPDLSGFAGAVQVAARTRSEGWPGNRKAFISHVWQSLSARHPEWGLNVIEFKGMLAEAHRTGHVVLANADIKDKKHIRDFQESAIAYKNTVWHFVRVED